MPSQLAAPPLRCTCRPSDPEVRYSIVEPVGVGVGHDENLFPLGSHPVAANVWLNGPETGIWPLVAFVSCELAEALSHRTNSISLGRHSLVKNDSSGL